MSNKIIWFIGFVLALGLIYMFTIGSDSKNLPEQNRMTFFVTSKNPGQGANFGGISGADSYCQSLAESVGAGDLNWKAYLSSVATGTDLAVNARDRIGSGPWHNAKGELVASDITELHLDNKINKQTALDEKGNIVLGRGDELNNHDILTGSQVDGTAFATSTDTTCENWTLGSTTGSAFVGHHDRIGPNESDWAKSWNSSHNSRGCGLPQLRSTGGAGLLYCFVSN